MGRRPNAWSLLLLVGLVATNSVPRMLTTRLFATTLVSGFRLDRITSPLRRPLAFTTTAASPRDSQSMRRLMSSTTATTRADQALSGKVRVPIATAIDIHGHDNVVFVDGSWWLHMDQRATTSRHDYETGPRIAGARFLDIEDVCSPAGSPTNEQGLPHMMSTADTWARVMDAMGVTNAHHVIVYGQTQCPFLYRAFVQFTSMGHDPDRVHVLDGSLADWQAASGPMDDQPTTEVTVASLSTSTPLCYQATGPRNVYDLETMLQLARRRSDAPDLDDTIVVDVRSADRFYGRVNEPRPGLRLGHMPHARHLFFMDLLDPREPARLRPTSELRTLLDAHFVGSVVSSSCRIVATCGTGVTACALIVALLECGVAPSRVALYDGSWCEWGSPVHETPIVTDSVSN